MASRAKFKSVSSVKRYDVGEPCIVWFATFNTIPRTPECKLEIPSGEQNSPTFSCTGGIL